MTPTLQAPIGQGPGEVAVTGVSQGDTPVMV
jgi:hypothetical protein